jgi:hypothetical protein
MNPDRSGQAPINPIDKVNFIKTLGISSKSRTFGVGKGKIGPYPLA